MARRQRADGGGGGGEAGRAGGVRSRRAELLHGGHRRRRPHHRQCHISPARDRGGDVRQRRAHAQGAVDRAARGQLWARHRRARVLPARQPRRTDHGRGAGRRQLRLALWHRAGRVERPLWRDEGSAGRAAVQPRRDAGTRALLNANHPGRRRAGRLDECDARGRVPQGRRRRRRGRQGYAALRTPRPRGLRRPGHGRIRDGAAAREGRHGRPDDRSRCLVPGRAAGGRAQQHSGRGEAEDAGLGGVAEEKKRR
mmetsp:Transcript_20958/g.70880  ORF Transcript_20958/g.70880 Transcript_20958/m.70880 type:complete len:254 (-) Transcript_20958:50-811(-)